MALPPFEAGAVHVSFAQRAPACAVSDRGAPGAVAAAGGGAGASFEPTLGPTAEIAFTVKKYFLPFVSPVTVNVRADVGNGLAFTGVEDSPCAAVPLYTLKPVTGLPPSFSLATHVSAADVLPGN